MSASHVEVFEQRQFLTNLGLVRLRFRPMLELFVQQLVLSCMYTREQTAAKA